MSEQVVAQEQYLVRAPWSGEQIDVTNPAVVASALVECRRIKDQIKQFEEAATQMLLDTMDTHGQWTMRFGDVEVVGDTPGDDYFYDEEDFRKLLDAGLPESRFNEIVKTKVTRTIDRTKAKALLKVPQYAEIVEKARRDRPKTRRVKTR
jgi:hypothetical protein